MYRVSVAGSVWNKRSLVGQNVHLERDNRFFLLTTTTADGPYNEMDVVVPGHPGGSRRPSRPAFVVGGRSVGRSATTVVVPRQHRDVDVLTST